MIKKIINKNVILVALVAMLASSIVHPVRGDTINNEGDNFSYVFHLYYDNGRLVVDRTARFNYDPIPEQFIQLKISTPDPYRGEIVNNLGKMASTFQFDPKSGDPNFTKGKISVKAPYFADAKEINFYDNKNVKLLTISVSNSSFCNDDGKCNGDVGEDNNNCPNDCKVAPTLSPLPSSAPISETGKLFGISVTILIYVGIGLIILILFWIAWKWWHKRQIQNDTLK